MNSSIKQTGTKIMKTVVLPEMKMMPTVVAAFNIFNMCNCEHSAIFVKETGSLVFDEIRPEFYEVQQ
jgi:hypothetical protein